MTRVESNVACMMVLKLGRLAEVKGDRNNSINGMTGFNPTIQPIFPVNDSFLYNMGVKKNNPCIMIRMTCCKSLKNTVATDMIKPIPSAKKNRNRYAMGINITSHVSDPPIAKMITKSARNERTLSINSAIAMLRGKINLGKYIFFMSPSLFMKDEPDCVTTELK